MGWGGAPPWVYKNEASYHASDAMQARSEASRANEMLAAITKDKKLLMIQINGILSEITKYQEKKSNKKISKKEMEEIIENIKKIVLDSKEKTE